LASTPRSLSNHGLGHDWALCYPRRRLDARVWGIQPGHDNLLERASLLQSIWGWAASGNTPQAHPFQELGDYSLCEKNRPVRRAMPYCKNQYLCTLFLCAESLRVALELTSHRTLALPHPPQSAVLPCHVRHRRRHAFEPGRWKGTGETEKSRNLNVSTWGIRRMRE
jgi:hypothetical protein